MLQRFIRLFCCVGLVLVVSAAANAQFGRDDDDDDDDDRRGRRRGGFGERGFRGGDEGGFGRGGFGGRGGFERGGFERGSFGEGGFGGRGGFGREGFDRGSRGGGGDPTEFLRRLDQDGNGQLDPAEMQGRTRFLVDRIAREANLDTNQPISLIKLQEAMQQARERRMNGQNGPSPGNSATTTRGEASKPAEPSTTIWLVPGFGSQFETVAVPGFGDPLAVAAFGSTSTSTSTTTATAAASPAATEDRGDRRERGRSRGDDDEDDSGRRGRGERSGAGAARSTNTPSTSTPSASSPSASTPSAGAGQNPAQDRIRRIAQAMLNRYDANKNGTLEREEWSKMSNEPEKGDKNGDGQITLDEMTARLSDWSPSGSRGSSTGGSSAGGSSTATTSAAPTESRGRGGFDRGGRSRGAGGRGGFGGGGSRGGFGGRDSTASRPTTNAAGKAYRFLTPAERLPEGLPSEFTSKDRDGDGQVSMAEFTSTWSESKLAQFNRWDLNGDGWITAVECLAAENRTARAR